MSRVLSKIFTSFASLTPGGDSYYYGDWLEPIALDIMGPDPMYCYNSTDLGIAGFEKRMSNVAVAISNA
jgi:hypothetical protein